MTVMAYDGPALGLMVAFALGWVPAVVAGISAIASIWTAKKQADAAKQAANIQVQGTRDAQGYIDKAYQQSTANLQPWINTGQQAATTMGQLMGFGGGGGATAAPTAPVAAGTTKKNLSAWDTMTPEEKAYVSSGTTQRNMKAYLAGDESRDPSTTGLFAPTPNPQTVAEARSQSSYVKMQAPDGTVQPVPSQYVPHYTKLGAKVVG